MGARRWGRTDAVYDSFCREYVVYLAGGLNERGTDVDGHAGHVLALRGHCKRPNRVCERQDQTTVSGLGCLSNRTLQDL